MAFTLGMFKEEFYRPSYTNTVQVKEIEFNIIMALVCFISV